MCPRHHLAREGELPALPAFCQDSRVRHTAAVPTCMAERRHDAAHVCCAALATEQLWRTLSLASASALASASTSSL
jgi:hypothetical protein